MHSIKYSSCNDLYLDPYIPVSETARNVDPQADFCLLYVKQPLGSNVSMVLDHPTSALLTILIGQVSMPNLTALSPT